MLLHELLTGRVPFPSDGDATAQRAAIVFATPDLDGLHGANAPARRLAQQLLSKQAYLRPTARDALASEFVAHAAPPSPDEAAAWVQSLRALHDDLLPRVDATPARAPKPARESLGSQRTGSAASDLVSPGPPSSSSSLVGGSP